MCLEKMGIVEHLVVLMLNLYIDQKAKKTIEHGETVPSDWQRSGKMLHAACFTIQLIN